MPGVASSRRRCHSSYCSTSWRSGGRGPTRLMSPRSTLSTCGSSSMRSLRITADAGHARIVVLRPARLAGRFGIDTHAAELHQAKHASAEPDARLPVEHRGAQAVLDLDGNHRREDRGQSQNDQDASGDEIEQARRDLPQRAAPEALAEDDPARVEHVDAHASGLALEKGEQLRDVHSCQPALEQLPDREDPPPVIERHHDFIYVEATADLLEPLALFEHRLGGAPGMLREASLGLLALRTYIADHLEGAPVGPAPQSRNGTGRASHSVDQHPDLENLIVDEMREDDVQ